MKRLKTFIIGIIMLVTAFFFTACKPNTPSSSGGNGEESESGSGSDSEQEIDTMEIYFTIGETKLAATLVDNSATAALKQKLKTAPITIDMNDYGGFEKVGGLGFSLPTSNEKVTTAPCDFVLYQGNQLVIFYGSNSWSYTRLGKITGVTASELKAVLGNGSVTVTLSLKA